MKELKRRTHKRSKVLTKQEKCVLEGYPQVGLLVQMLEWSPWSHSISILLQEELWCMYNEHAHQKREQGL